jgi:hypothetical protein
MPAGGGEGAVILMFGGLGDSSIRAYLLYMFYIIEIRRELVGPVEDLLRPTRSDVNVNQLTN